MAKMGEAYSYLFIAVIDNISFEGARIWAFVKDPLYDRSAIQSAKKSATEDLTEDERQFEESLFPSAIKQYQSNPRYI